MILRCDYEKAWKELRECFENMAKSENRKHQEYNVFGLDYFNIMNSLEKKHTNIIDIKRRSNEKVAGAFMRKYMEMYAKYIDLKSKLKKLYQES
jgi:hypothetical protein